METPTNRKQHRGHEQTLTNKRPRRSVSPPPPLAAGPRWLLLNSCIDDVSAADAKTAAASCTSSGKPFRISFGVAAPPACCSLHFAWLSAAGTPSKPKPSDVRVVAGHDDALLFKIRHGQPPTTTFDDYFLYEAGDGARAPSLSLLPGIYVPVQSSAYRKHRDPTPSFRDLNTKNNAGILRRGEDDLVVCQYKMTCDWPISDTALPIYDTAWLCMLRIGRDREWVVRRVPVVEHREGSSELQPWHGRRGLIPNAVVPVGNRFLCWVDYSDGFLVCDMADDEAPKLRYVPMPATQHYYGYCGHYPNEMRAHCTLGAAGSDAVRFVSVSPPRCRRCDVPGKKASCEGSSSSFKVTAWTMTLSTEEATTWVKDVVLDRDEIWKWRQLPNYGCLPRDKHLEYPMVSSDDPDVIYFKMECMAVAINMRSKKLLSVVFSGRDQDEDEESAHMVTAKLRWG